MAAAEVAEEEVGVVGAGVVEELCPEAVAAGDSELVSARAGSPPLPVELVARSLRVTADLPIG